MKIFSIYIFLTAIFSLNGLVYCQDSSFQWAIECGNPPNTTDTKTILTSDQSGHVIQSGEFLDTAMFGDKTLISAGGTDIFLVKYDAQGEAVWANRIGATDYDYVQKITTDQDGNILMAGYFYGTTLIGTDNYTSFGSQDIFLAKFNADGEFLWSIRAGSQMADYIMDVKTDAFNNIFITGYFYHEIQFGDTLLEGGNGSDIYIAKYNPGGVLQSLVQAGGSSSDQVRSLSCDPSGNIVITGSFYYDIQIGDTLLTTQEPVGVFLAKFDNGLNLTWVRQIHGSSMTIEAYATTDEEENIYLAGDFSEEVFLGDSIFDAGPFNEDIYVARLDPSGNVIWARHAYSIGPDQVAAIDVDSYDNLYMAGHYLDTITFGEVTLPYTLCCGSREIFIVNYTVDGIAYWGNRITGARAKLQDMTLSDEDEIYLSGSFADTVHFGALALIHPGTNINFMASLRGDIFTSVPQLKESDDFLVWPNPAHSFIQIDTGFTGRNFMIEIYDPAGRKFMERPVSTGNKIDISNLPKGLYVLRVSGNSRSAPLTSKLIVY
jgi:hypothetical protein